MPRTSTRGAARILLSVMAAAALSLTVTIAAPSDAAEAQSGYRLCGAWNSGESWSPHGDQITRDPKSVIGTGLVAKVWMKGGETCSSKIAFMQEYYGSAYATSSAKRSFRMIRCEDFAAAISGNEWDPCTNFEVNKIYRYSSVYDAVHPAPFPVFSLWHD
jgi:hypothetical protein